MNDNKTTAKLIYILFILGLIPAFGLFTSIVGVVIAYINKDNTAHWLQSHYIYQIKTFWLSLFISLAGWLLTTIIIGYVILVVWFFWLIIRCAKGMKALDKDISPFESA
jgi:uncharacterized membrane protein